MTAGKRNQFIQQKNTSRISSTECEDVKVIFVLQMSALLYMTTI